VTLTFKIFHVITSHIINLSTKFEYTTTVLSSVFFYPNGVHYTEAERLTVSATTLGLSASNNVESWDWKLYYKYRVKMFVSTIFNGSRLLYCELV